MEVNRKIGHIKRIIEYYWKLFPLCLPDCTISTTGNKALVLQKGIIIQDCYVEK
jgi:hypothetical protein